MILGEYLNFDESIQKLKTDFYINVTHLIIYKQIYYTDSRKVKFYILFGQDISHDCDKSFFFFSNSETGIYESWNHNREAVEILTIPVIVVMKKQILYIGQKAKQLVFQNL